MSFIALMVGLALVAYVARIGRGLPGRPEVAMRLGVAGAFLFTGIDHFLNATTRYLPMMPELLEAWALPLVLFTGAAEIAAALALLIPQAWTRVLGMPALHQWAGMGLIVLLACVVFANINVAARGIGVEGFAFPQWYFWTRPFFQPLIMLWVAYATGWVSRASSGKALRLHERKRSPDVPAKMP